MGFQSKAVLCLDVGKKRIGVSYCDQLGISITKAKTVIRDKSKSEYKIFEKLVTQKNITKLLVGLPLNDDGLMTNQSKDCHKYGLDLGTFLKIPCEFVNEHSSTWEAQSRFSIIKDKSGEIDGYASYILLEQWLRENL